jgi:hypothetical protein
MFSIEDDMVEFARCEALHNITDLMGLSRAETTEK